MSKQHRPVHVNATPRRTRGDWLGVLDLGVPHRIDSGARPPRAGRSTVASDFVTLP